MDEEKLGINTFIASFQAPRIHPASDRGDLAQDNRH
jgi:hypothetical protein